MKKKKSKEPERKGKDVKTSALQKTLLEDKSLGENTWNSHI